MTATFETYYYPAMGHGSRMPVLGTGSIKECREIIRSHLGVTRLAAWRKWDGTDDDVEAYHEATCEGSGGYAIRRIDD